MSGHTEESGAGVAAAHSGDVVLSAKSNPKHPAVRDVQGALRSAGVLVEQDGVYGQATEAAVRKFQKRSGLWPDGVAGPDTLRRLFAARIGHASMKPTPRYTSLSGGASDGVEVLNERWRKYVERELRPAVLDAADRYAFGPPDGRADTHNVRYHLDRTLDDYARRLPRLVDRSGFLGRVARLNSSKTADELDALERSVAGAFDGPLGEFVVWLEDHLAQTLPFAGIDVLLNGVRNDLGLPTPLAPVAGRISETDTRDPFRQNLLDFLREPIGAVRERVRENAADMQRHAADGRFLYFLDHFSHAAVRAELARRVGAEDHLREFADRLGASPAEYDRSLLPRLEAWLYDHLLAGPLRELEALATAPEPEPSLWDRVRGWTGTPAKTRPGDGPREEGSPVEAPLAERRRAVAAQVGDLVVTGERPITLDGRTGVRYDLHHGYPYTGRGDVDDALSRFPVAVFLPDRFGERRPTYETPVVLGMQGIGAPFEWNGFVVPTLLDMGVACVLFETPLAGQRGLVRSAPVDFGRELRPLVDRRVPFDAPFLERLMDGVSRDVRAVLGLLGERHDLVDPRQAMFGVSMGTLFTAFAFMRDGVGQRLLGVIGHGDLAAFARSYFAPFTRLANTPVGAALEALGGPVNDLARQFGVHDATAFIPFARLLTRIADDPESARDANPYTFRDRVRADRPVRYLVGGRDGLCAPGDTRLVAATLADGRTEVVADMGHEAWVPETRAFLERHLSDWRW